MEKKGENQKEIKSLRMELGNRLEGLVAELFTEETGSIEANFEIKEDEDGQASIDVK